jgi:prepilin-type processing-associated H-X9-DG protein
MSCVNHLKQIGLALRMWSNDSDAKFPWDVSLAYGGTKDFVATGQAWRHFQAISNELNSPKVLVCPNEKERTRVTEFAALNDSHLSYFVGLSADETKPQTILSGDRNLAADGKPLQGAVALSTNAVLGWASFNHMGYGNIALADGRVEQTTPDTVNKQLQSAFLSTTQSVLRFAFPQ